jgi:KaiC/GvpD/RAD55 family RecA-like ATPase
MVDPEAETVSEDDEIPDADALSWVEALDPGTTLLLAGPPMTGKRALLYRIVAADRTSDRGRLLVTTRKTGDAVETEYRQAHPDVAEDRLAIVDCVSDEYGFEVADTDRMRFTHDPGDMTGIGIHVSEFMRRFHEDPQIETVEVGLHNLSTMLMYAELRRVYQFLHVLVARIAAAEFRGTFVIDESPESQRLNTLAQPFDGLLEVRMEDEREYRVRGVEAGPRNWTGI